ncbi:peptidase [Bacillus alkalicellulosilyticus]|uniref:peptidase n=1 Tax=Alkalihalobacterium alkalicellulosilyticum TaxID=1912214 RepID=UPI000998C2F3|nr:peptidase [Bacillus alkalicellulosilyticus]
MKLSLGTQLTLFPLDIRKDNKHYIVEEVTSGDFFEMPKICIDAIRLLEEGQSLGSVELQLKKMYPNDSVNLIEFAQQLLDLKLVKEINGIAFEDKKENQVEKGYTWISPLVGRFFFNTVSNKLYILLFLASLIIFILNPHLFPSYKNVFLFDAIVPSLLTWLALSLVLVLVHEFGHILAVRSFDLPAKMGIGNRLFFVVFETDLSTAWKLSVKERNVLYFGGICFDLIILFGALLLQLLFPESHPLVQGILKLMVLDVFIRMIYQCCFYMKTDFYYVCENVTGCYNLMENGKQLLQKKIPFLKTEETTQLFDGEERIVRLYGWFYITGVVLTFGLFGGVFIPQMYYAFSRSLPGLLQPITTAPFWDAAVFLGQSILMIGLLLYAIRKKRIYED